MAGVGVVLSGGGARGAYEAGVLAWILEDAGRRGHSWRPHAVCGTSVGAIHTAFLATALSEPAGEARRLESVWNELHIEDVLRVGVAQAMSTWRVALGGGRAGSLFDARPLTTLVGRAIPWGRIRENIQSGLVKAVTVTATHVPSGRPVVFLERRPEVPVPVGIGRRIVCHEAAIGLQHVMASAAIPLVFAPIPIKGDLYCDGGLRLNTPMEPAIRLGSDRLFVIALNVNRPEALIPELGSGRYPGAPFLLGKMLNAFLIDHVAHDLEHLDRINGILQGVEAAAPGLVDRLAAASTARGEPAHRIIPALVVRPSEDLGMVAEEHLRRLSVRAARGAVATAMLKLLDAGEGTGSDVASYLLFDEAYTRELLALGRRDAAARADEIRAFLFGDGAA